MVGLHSILCVLPLMMPAHSMTPVSTIPVFDPCHNYTVLDEPWRATTNTDEYNHCDSKDRVWHGWYRMMYYGWNIRIPEKCVSRGCGTSAQMWMNGAHPQLQDGIVTRKMCESGSNCCSWTFSNRVKACPGNYYVYELRPVGGCYFAFCTDVDTISAPTPVPLHSSTGSPTLPLTNPCDELHCSQYEVCGEAHGIHDCVCSPNFFPARESFGFSARCSKISSWVYLTRCVLAEAGFPAEVLHLNDPNCRANVNVNSHQLTFKFSLKDKTCGTVLKANETHIIYENSVQGKVNFTEGLISRQRRLNLQFACVYPVSRNASMGQGIHTLTSMDLMKESVQGYSAFINPYKDADFMERFTGNVSVQSDEKIYIAVETSDLDSREFSIVLDSCWATPISNPTSSIRWDLITNQCPNPEDGTVEVLRNGLSTSSRLSFRMFTFDGFSSQVYLHCSLHICTLGGLNCIPNCNPGHQQRARRSSDKHDKITISSGPLSFPASSTDVLDVGAPQPKRRSPKV